MLVLGVHIDFRANKISNFAENSRSSSESETVQENVFTMNVTITQTFLPDRKSEMDKLDKKLSKNKLYNGILDILASSKI